MGLSSVPFLCFCLYHFLMQSILLHSHSFFLAGPICMLNAYHIPMFFISYSYWSGNICLCMSQQLFSSSSKVNWFLCLRAPIVINSPRGIFPICGAFPLLQHDIQLICPYRELRRFRLNGPLSLPLCASPHVEPRL